MFYVKLFKDTHTAIYLKKNKKKTRIFSPLFKKKNKSVRTSCIL